MIDPNFGRIGRIGSFLYQLEDGPDPANLWSGKLGADNGNDPEHALAAAKLFAAAPALLAALRRAKAEVDYQRAGHMSLRRIDRERLDHLARVFEAAISEIEGRTP